MEDGGWEGEGEGEGESMHAPGCAIAMLCFELNWIYRTGADGRSLSLSLSPLESVCSFRLGSKVSVFVSFLLLLVRSCLMSMDVSLLWWLVKDDVKGRAQAYGRLMMGFPLATEATLPGRLGWPYST